jgi:prepilin-type N-terminal cleavage/methylation domain-containing protein
MKAKHAGFTLIELMFVITLGVLLLGIGLPSFRDFIRSGRITTAANDLVADYNLARSEAVKRRLPVTLCKSDDGATCDPDEDTAFTGWILFIDDADATGDIDGDGDCEYDEGECQELADGEVDAGEVVLRGRALPETLEVAADGVLTSFLASGFPDDEPGPSFAPLEPLTQLVLCDERGNEVSVGGVSAARGLRISATGRTTISRDKDFIEDELGGCP